MNRIVLWQTQVSRLEGSLQVEANTIKSSNRREDGRTDTYAPPRPPTIVIYDAPSNILCWSSCWNTYSECSPVMQKHLGENCNNTFTRCEEDCLLLWCGVIKTSTFAWHYNLRHRDTWFYEGKRGHAKQTKKTNKKTQSEYYRCTIILVLIRIYLRRFAEGGGLRLFLFTPQIFEVYYVSAFYEILWITISKNTITRHKSKQS